MVEHTTTEAQRSFSDRLNNYYRRLVARTMCTFMDLFTSITGGDRFCFDRGLSVCLFFRLYRGFMCNLLRASR